MNLQTETRASYLKRIVSDGSNEAEWLRARRRGVTATDVARLTSRRTIEAVARQKLYGSSFTGNAYTEHGKAREPVIAEWMLEEHGIPASKALFHAAEDLRHLATPDGVVSRSSGRVELAEIKTTNKPWRTVPRHYMRQIWWQQYVLGADRTLLVWEQHEDFVPVADPQCLWIERDDNEIAKLLGLVTELIDHLIEKSTYGS